MESKNTLTKKKIKTFARERNNMNMVRPSVSVIRKLKLITIFGEVQSTKMYFLIYAQNFVRYFKAIQMEGRKKSQMNDGFCSIYTNRRQLTWNIKQGSWKTNLHDNEYEVQPFIVIKSPIFFHFHLDC